MAEFGAKGRTVELGRNTLIKEIDEGLRGMSPGETREVPVTFPETHRQKELAGKVGSFRLTLTALQEKVLPELDDEFAKDTGAESLEALKASTLATLQKQFADRQQGAVLCCRACGTPSLYILQGFGQDVEITLCAPST